MNQSVTAVIGDGWAALGAVGFLVSSGVRVRWISGTSAHLIPPLPSLEVGEGAFVWLELFHRLQIDAGELKTGSFIREFRNKAFREPLWTNSPTPEMRRDVRNEVLWIPEIWFAAAFEARFELSLGELELVLRRRLAEIPCIKRIEGVPVVGLKRDERAAGSPVTAVVLGSGEEISCNRVIYADRWSELSAMKGLPKPLPFVKGRMPVGALQALFTHKKSVTPGLLEGFYGVMNKEAGEDIQRSVWGYFFENGNKSVWTLFLSSEEAEDNHSIAKKLRRMKQTLDRMFTGSEWLPEGKPDFMSTIKEEQVRFDESLVFTHGNMPTEPIMHTKMKGISFLTDGYGPTSSMHQVRMLLGEELAITISQEGEMLVASSSPGSLAEV